jgi:hypothetical protein
VASGDVDCARGWGCADNILDAICGACTTFALCVKGLGMIDMKKLVLMTAQVPLTRAVPH